MLGHALFKTGGVREADAVAGTVVLLGCTWKDTRPVLVLTIVLRLILALPAVTGRVLAVSGRVLAVRSVLEGFPVIFGFGLVVLAERVLPAFARGLAELERVLPTLTAGLGWILGWLVVPGHLLVGTVDCNLAGAVFRLVE